MNQDPVLTRENLKSPRAAAIAGIIFSTLFICVEVFLRKSIPPNPLGSATQLIEQLKGFSLALRLVPFAGIAFLWFIAVIRDRLEKLEDRFFVTVFLGSGLVYLAMILVCAAMTGALLEVLESEPQKIIESGAYTLSRASIYGILHIYSIRMAAVFMISVSTIVLRTQFVPRLVAFIGFVLALVLLIGVDAFDWAALAFPLWALLMSILLLIQRYRGHSDTEQESVAAAR